MMRGTDRGWPAVEIGRRRRRLVTGADAASRAERWLLHTSMSSGCDSSGSSRNSHITTSLSGPVTSRNAEHGRTATWLTLAQPQIESQSVESGWEEWGEAGSFLLEVRLNNDGASTSLVKCEVLGTQGATHGLTLMLPGVGTSRSTYSPLFECLLQHGWGVLIPDLGGVDPNELSRLHLLVTRVAEAVAIAELGSLRAVIGHSLGTHLALVGLRQPLADSRLVAILVSSGLHVARDQPSDAAPGLTCPLLVVQSRDDILSRYAGGRNVFDASTGPKAMVSLEGADHGAGLCSDSATSIQAHVGNVIVSFLDGAESGAWSRLEDAGRRLEAARLGEFEFEPSHRQHERGPLREGRLDEVRARGTQARDQSPEAIKVETTELRSRADLLELVGDRSREELIEVLLAFGIDRLLHEAFTHISERFLPGQAEGREVDIQWLVTSPLGVHPFVFRIADDRCLAEAGEDGGAALTVRIDVADFALFIAGKLDAMSAFVSGGLRVSGDLTLAVVLEKWFNHD